MNISAKTEYACIAVLELAKNASSAEPLRVRDIAETHGIPSRFLVQILLQLKGAGIVSSTRGASGGYRLVEKPETISLYRVMSVIEGSQPVESNLKEVTPSSRVLNLAWKSIHESSIQKLEEITFEELVADVNSQPETMYYI
ncbi:MAG: Rrf2 family transcriptional regulator [Planctomycetota bacterium]|nr:Rrf2 family transcriptional regulator [Planctomycetota bacterium]